MGAQAIRDEEQLNRRWRPPLMAFFIRRVRDHHEAEDLTQEVFVRLLGQGELGAKPPDGYVFQVAANLLRDRARRGKVRADHWAVAAPLEDRDSESLDPARIAVGRDALATLVAGLGEPAGAHPDDLHALPHREHRHGCDRGKLRHLQERREEAGDEGDGGVDGTDEGVSMNGSTAGAGPMGRDEQAAEWCLRLADRSLAEHEQQELHAWLQDPLNLEAFEQATVVWQGVEAAADGPQLIHLRTQALESFRRANSRRWARRIPARWGWAAAAASLAVAAFGIYLFRGAPVIYETEIAERRSVVLEDGSRLSLDAATRVEVRLADDQRALRLLAGRAKFDVAKDPLRPFSVAAGNKVVVATGTSFSVELLRQQLRVVLYEGRVEVLEQQGMAAKPKPLQLDAASVRAGVELTPGRELLAGLEQPTATLLPADATRSLSWESGQLNFVNEPLSSAVERMNRYARERLVIGDATAAGFSINGVFTAGDTEAFIEGLRTFRPVDVVRQQGEILIRSAEHSGEIERSGVPTGD